MSDTYTGEEKRQFLRQRHEKPVRYKVLNIGRGRKGASRFMDAVSKNLSASGILFSSNDMPKISSLLVLELDYRIAQICKEIEENALIVNNKLFGKVVRIEDNGSGLYDIGVAFIKKFDDLTENIKALIYQS